MRKILPLGLILPVAATAEAAGHRQQHADQVLTKLNALIKEWNCTQLYLDVGMNVGQQVRKIYEPATFIQTHDPRLKRTPALEKAQRAIMQKSMTLFEKAFGTSHERCSVCSLGFEPNPLHRDKLQSVRSGLRAAGVGVEVVFGAASTADDVMTLSYTAARPTAARLVADPSAAASPEPARSREKSSQSTLVPTYDLARIVRHALSALSTRPPPPPGRARLAMKVDIEGAEYQLMPHLIREGVLCEIGQIAIEWTPANHFASDSVGTAKVQHATHAAARKCNVDLEPIDDEYHAMSSLPMPERLCPTS